MWLNYHPPTHQSLEHRCSSLCSLPPSSSLVQTLLQGAEVFSAFTAGVKRPRMSSCLATKGHPTQHPHLLTWRCATAGVPCVCTNESLCPRIRFDSLHQAFTEQLLWAGHVTENTVGKTKHSVAPLYPGGICSKTPGGCLKPRRVPKPNNTIWFFLCIPMRKFNF